MHRIMHTSKWEGNEVGVDRIGKDYRNSQRFTEECSIKRYATSGTPPLKYCLAWKVGGKRMQIGVSRRWIESSTTYCWWCDRVRSKYGQKRSRYRNRRSVTRIQCYGYTRFNWVRGWRKQAEGKSSTLPSTIWSSELRYYWAYSKVFGIRDRDWWPSAIEMPYLRRKHANKEQSRKDTGINSPTERIGGVICSDLKGPITPHDRRGNRYLVNFIDYKSNYCRVSLAKTKNEAATKFQDFLTYFEKRFDCKIHVLRTDGGAEYRNVDIFCKEEGVRR